MSELTKLVAVTLFGSVAAAWGLTQMRESKAQQPPRAPQQVASLAQAPAPPQPGNTAMLYADPRGHFFADVQVRGIPIRALVDTGASVVSFSTEDAAKFGLRPDASQPKRPFGTANGTVVASIVRIPEIRLQGITVFDVEAAIMPPGAMKGTLLGMSFMKKLQSYESRGSSMVMRK
jgi:aspartyl protease family protein